ncbi:MAG: preprotein translocase subunit SecG [Planctomycetota bacterium]|nr:preprotein translocase subunit SecG [Planctomycetota bacterium]
MPLLFGGLLNSFLNFLLFGASGFIILLVLVQRGRGGGLTGALGGMGGQSAFGAKAGDVFTKITVVSTFVWIILCLFTINQFTYKAIDNTNVGEYNYENLLEGGITSSLGDDPAALGVNPDDGAGTSLLGADPATTDPATTDPENGDSENQATRESKTETGPSLVAPKDLPSTEKKPDAKSGKNESEGKAPEANPGDDANSKSSPQSLPAGKLQEKSSKPVDPKK